MTLNLITLQAQSQGGGYQGIIMIVLLIAIFYFMMIRPQQKKQKEIRKFREALGKGDKVITAGGIHGTVQAVKDDCFVVSIAPNIEIRVDKGSVYPSAQAAAEQQNAQK